MRSHRFVALAVVLSLLLVPALARAAQPLDFGKRPTAESSFKKSFDFPPELVVVAPDRSFTSLDVEALQHPTARDVAAQPDAIPDTPDIFDADALRGPPASLA